MNAPQEEFEAIETAAADWLARRDRGFTAAEAADFARWRAADPRHEAVVDEMELVWGALDDLSSAPTVTTAPSPAAPATTLKRQALARWWPAWGLAAMLAIVAGAALWLGRAPRAMEQEVSRHSTGVGLREIATLSDGTQIQLNTDTALTVRYTSGERRVTLERGEAFFHVAKNPARPFIVTAGDTEARVLGTQFVVRLSARETEVVVSEGRVNFSAKGRAGEVLTAAKRAVLGTGTTGAPRVSLLDPGALARRLAWQFGRLDFKEAPLREVVAEFNRYNVRKLVLRDPEAEQIGITGKWDIGNVDGLVGMLGQTTDVVEVRRNADEIVLGMRR